MAAPQTDPHSPQEGAQPGLIRVLLNLGHLIGGKAGAGLMSLVYLVIATHRLGPRDYGILVLVSAYAGLVGVVIAFSGFHGVVRYGAIARERGDKAELARIIRFMAVVELCCGAAAVLIAAVAVPWVGPRLGWSPEAQAFALPFSLGVLGTVRATPQGILQIAGRFDLIGLHQLANPTVRLIGSLLCWVLGGGLTAFLAVWLASLVAECVAMWALAAPSWRLLTGARLIGPWRHRQPGFGRFILAANADITLRELAPNLAPLTVGWMLGPTAAGLLALAQRAANILSQPAALLGQASYSVLAELTAAGNTVMLRRTVWRSVGLALVIAVLILGLLTMVGEPLLALIGGKGFAVGAALLLPVAAARALALASAPLVSGLAAIGRAGWLVVTTTVTSLILYPLLPLLLLWIGLIGAGWHMLLQGVVAALMLGWLFERQLAAKP
ncbi:O-antigen/teichoic acid export membrane protein [Sphingomonas vulcanisoli]|uniref:O-antigen/teichoic acid export membrane protein n=1 Tax=Sphingomonas vulcanisoli TaxID=1658060 RepID=A0ABX0TR50_9SPHN|nr:lipopolysaccharide biosynthesis protein [Sphingomonas vulcanisoli]NIJ07563.1 O-antigen/teichoic acid export membrane protein [Sphingomonas vulcanisoli]